MSKKVTLLELVATKIVYAVLIAVYYWMWARRDWHDYYQTIQNVVTVFTVLFLLLQASRVKRFNKEIVDELAVINLKRTDSICLKIVTVVSILVAFVGAMEIINQLQMGYIIMLLLVVMAVARTLIFYIMDAKGV